jgi:PBSX family phage terminase large subunit
MKPFGRKSYDFIMRDPALDKRYTIFSGSVRSSKTFTLTAKQVIQYNRYEVGGKRLMTGSTKGTIYRNVLIDLFAIVGKENYSYNFASGELWLFGKQWFVLGAKDESSYKQILGMTVGLCIGDEIVEYPKSFLAQLWLRMSPDGARFAGSTNPGTPYCYLKSEVIDNKDFADDLEVITLNLDDNPNISKKAKQSIISSQVGVYKARYIDGLWVVAEGAIWKDSWDEQGNTYADEPRLEPKGQFKYAARPRGLENAGGHTDHWFAVDPGVDHPQVYGEFFDDGKIVRVDRVWRWDSRKEMRQLTDAQYADALEKFMTPRFRGCEIRLPPEAASFRAELKSRGLFVREADNSVKEGIHTVSSLLATRRLLINVDHCEGLEKKILAYAWDDAARKRGDEEPLKVQDDDVDMLRYGVHSKIPQWRVSEP